MKNIDGKLFKEMVVTGAIVLHNNHPEIDALNVFPVPDGDTGTNMSLTFSAGASEIEKLDSTDIYEVAKKLSKGLLMGARGNSGVILSQIFRGVSMAFEGKKEVNAVELAQAFKNGAKVAYKAVMRPVEGTILTVIREASDAVVQYAQEGMEIEDVFSYFVKEAEESLERTPELLPVLKEVGVVDSGGAGLLLVFTGFMAALAGEEIERVEIKNDSIFSDLLYLGQADIPYRRGAELYFQAPLKKYTMDIDKKKNAHIKFSANTTIGNCNFYIKVYSNGSASIYITLQQGKSINFLGELNMRREETESL